MIKFFCDFCGSEIRKNEKIISLSLNSENIHKNNQICDYCYKKILKLERPTGMMEDKENDNN